MYGMLDVCYKEEYLYSDTHTHTCPGRYTLPAYLGDDSKAQIPAGRIEAQGEKTYISCTHFSPVQMLIIYQSSVIRPKYNFPLTGRGRQKENSWL